MPVIREKWHTLTKTRHKDNGDNVFRNYSISSITLNIF